VFYSIFSTCPIATIVQLPLILPGIKPGDNVLDIAAAPGSKACQILSEFKGKGKLIANDFSVKRMQPLNVNMQRSGASNFYMVKMWGERLGQYFPEYFDKVLVDAPCTALGTLNSSPEIEQWWQLGKLKKLNKTQYALLISAIKALKVGGELVYSTCSIAPEENELLINKILKDYPVEIVETPKTIAEQFERGVTVYNGEKLNSMLSNGIRIYPHIHGYEGFFSIKLRKYDSIIRSSKTKNLRTKLLLNADDARIRPVLENLTENWGIKESFWGNYKFNLTKNRLWMVSNIDNIPVNNLICAGTLLAEKRLFGWKLLNNSVNLLGNLITKRKIGLNDVDLKVLFREGYLTNTNYDNGYYVLTNKEEPIASVYVEDRRMQIRLPHSFNLVLR